MTMNCACAFEDNEGKKIRRMTTHLSFVTFVLFVSMAYPVFSQADRVADSLKSLVRTTKNDSVKAVAWRELARRYINQDVKKAIRFSDSAATLARQQGFKLLEAKSYQLLGTSYMYSGQLDSSVWMYKKAIAIGEEEKFPDVLSANFMNIGNAYYYKGEYQRALTELYKGMKITEENNLSKAYILGTIAMVNTALKDHNRSAENYRLAIAEAEKYEDFGVRMLLVGNYANTLATLGKFDEATKMLLECIAYRRSANDKFYLSNHLIALGKIYEQQEKYNDAYNVFSEALELKKQAGSMIDVADAYHSISRAEFFRKNIYASKKAALAAYNLSDSLNYLQMKYDASVSLARLALYQHDLSATKYYDSINTVLKDSLNIEEQRKITTETTARFETEKKEKENEVLRLDQLRQQTELSNQRYVILMTVVILIAVIVLLIVVTRSRQLFKKANALLQAKNEAIGRQHEEIVSQKQQIDSQMEELKLTQSQLVQSEKMASLGQMTSGIAHEINNPLAFISGGVEGLKYSFNALVGHAKKSKQTSEKEIVEIENEARGLMTNITNGVNRANKIITSLRTFSSPQGATFSKVKIIDAVEVALTMLNHKILDRGIVIKSSFEDNRLIVGNTSELCQVFSNLIDNAIHAMEDQMSKKEIFIRSVPSGENIVVTITDTGPGIPQKIQSKIMEPFFTTKPVGKGTGLGLSISYAIIEKHHGKIAFNSEEGMGTTFKMTFKAVQTQNV